MVDTGFAVSVHSVTSSRYLAGGVESGFRKVERDKYEPRLLQVKGRRNIRVQQVGTHSQCTGDGDGSSRYVGPAV